MQKIRKSVIDNILINKCSNAEINFLLYISQLQNNYGVIRHIHGKTVRSVLNISKQTFYNILESLSLKEIISVKKEIHCEWKITILNNSFIEYKDYGKDKGYITTQYDFLHELKFQKLKANAKLLALKMMRVLYRLDTDKSFSVRYDVLLNWIGIKNKHIMLQYLMSLEPYFVIYYNGNSIAFKLRKPSQDHYRHSNTDLYKYIKHRTIAWCRKKKISYTYTDINDYLLLFRQYYKKHKQLLFLFKQTTKEFGSIQPRLINRFVSMMA